MPLSLDISQETDSVHNTDGVILRSTDPMAPMTPDKPDYPSDQEYADHRIELMKVLP